MKLTDFICFLSHILYYSGTIIADNAGDGYILKIINIRCNEAAITEL